MVKRQVASIPVFGLNGMITMMSYYCYFVTVIFISKAVVDACFRYIEACFHSKSKRKPAQHIVFFICVHFNDRSVRFTMCVAITCLEKQKLFIFLSAVCTSVRRLVVCNVS